MGTFAQSGQKWSTGGNSTSADDFIGTTNSEPLLLKANNQLGIKIKPNGEVIFKPLDLNSATGPNGLILTDGQGKISRLNFNGDLNQVMLGNGTWGNIPATSSLWHQNGNGIYFNQGYVGIGTQYPVFQLDVAGDARISNNLYVGGGIVISDKMRANVDIKTRLMDADSIKMGADKVIYGETKIDGDVKLKFKLDVTGDANFQGSQSVMGNQSVLGSQFLQGNQDINGSLIARQGLLFASGRGIKETIAANGTTTYSYGKGSGGGGGVDPGLPFSCFNPATFPSAFVNHQMPGTVQIYPTDASGNYIQGGSVLNMQSWETVSSIDAAGGSDGNGGEGGGILLNYFCGKDVAICAGENVNSRNGRGGVVSMGHNVQIGKPWPADDYNIALNIKAAEQTGLFVASTSSTNPYNYGVVSSVNGESNKAFAVLLQHSNSDREIITLQGNGAATFGGNSVSNVMPTLYVTPSIVANQNVLGKVGIGTNAPATALHVKTGYVTISDLGDGTNTRTLLVDANGKLVPGTASSTTTSSWNLGGNTTITASEIFGTNSPTDLIIRTSGSPRIMVNSNGNIGIGTGTAIPDGILEIKDQTGASLVVKGNGWGDIESTTSIRPHFANGKDFTIYEGEVSSSTVKHRMVLYNGKVAFNSSYADRNLKVIGLPNEKTEMQLHSDDALQSSIYWATNASLSYGFGMSKDANNVMVGGLYYNINYNQPPNNPSAEPDKIMSFTKTQFGAQVWIGETKGNGIHSDARLSVDGKLISKSLYVTITGGQWADYVFDENYTLPKLSEVEGFYKTNHHLPEIPSSKEVEEKGINVSAMNSLLLKKIEELTIYLVEQEKAIENLNKKVTELDKKVNH